MNDSLGDIAFRMAYHDTPVYEFHRVFGHPISFDPSVIPSKETRVLRVQMLASELVELARAFGVDLKIDTTHSANEDECVAVRSNDNPYDVVEAADALGDLRYIVDGGNIVCGFPGGMILNEIHRSNMSKLGPDGKPIYRDDGKILRGPNWTPPDIASILNIKKEAT
jgi:predicted HAD superfamily Cof-like phosphohydrolase